jgi:hypothetical protein
MEWLFLLIGAGVLVFLMQSRKETALLERDVTRIAREIDDIFLDYMTFRGNSCLLNHNPYMLGFLNLYVLQSLMDVGLKVETIRSFNLFPKVYEASNLPYETTASSKGVSIEGHVNHLAREKHPDFMRGLEHSANVMGLRNRVLKPEFMSDPDIQNAFEIARREGLDQSYANVSKVLMRCYFAGGLSSAKNT